MSKQAQLAAKKSRPILAAKAPMSIVQQTLHSPGKALDAGTRQYFEPRLGHVLNRVLPGAAEAQSTDRTTHLGADAESQAQQAGQQFLSAGGAVSPSHARRFDLSHIRIHTDPQAAQSARSVGATAYTVGSHIVFDQGQYDPHSQRGRALLAHELAHTSQQASAGILALQRQPQAGAGGAAARPIYVFIMGQDPRRTPNPFYRVAERYYRAHIRNATFVTNLRSLSAVLNYISNNVNQPIGDLYIVTHANEDGTLSFGLNGADADARLDVRELRTALHPAGGGAGNLPQLGNQIDAQTRILIKGCDLGRTQEMVELVVEAFGGRGTVIAPTHEQGFSVDPTLAQQERQREQTRRIGEFEATQPEVPPVPERVDPALRGRERQQAVRQRQRELQARQRAIRERQQAVARERQRIAPEVAQAGEVAGMQEALSGPMLQRPGTQLFTAAEIQPQVDTLYPHLNQQRRRDITTRLVAPDRRPAGVAANQGTYRQQGQRLYLLRPYSFRFPEPRTLAEANRQFRYPRGFRATALRPPQRQPVAGGIQFTFEVDGVVSQRRGRPLPDTRTFIGNPVPDDNAMLVQGRARLNNPHRYAWRVASAHASSGFTTQTTIAERVVAYLHHGSLNPAAHQYFTAPLNDPRFYATSRFAPPAAPPAGAGGRETPEEWI